ncbi:hypothetical protein MM213_20420 [Belliella sp. R4-6]|uniref:DUF6705 domain-containing protein n=1 Tax=Belliella alkalica TaxID=1730871 RepID=A0ABS9VHG8_9BACT|nr:DUF6705 family protein [Belliella alkalica]MCH7415877.1 hypothetical protein [Belliella alkalica]
MKYSLIILLTIVVIVLPLSQSKAQFNINAEKLKDLEGAWFYQDEKIDFMVVLKHRKVNILETQKSNVFGYIKLLVDGILICDNLKFVEFLNSKNSFDFNEIYDIKNHPNRIPPIIISANEKGISGGIKILENANPVNFTVKFEDDHLVLEFINYQSRLDKKITKLENYPFPAVPSTWVLKKKVGK